MKYSSTISAMKKLILLLLTLATLTTPSPAVASPWVEVSSDGNSYLVSGGAIFHERYEQDREKAASCRDCYWQVQRTCLDFDAQDRGPCPELLASCPSGMHIAEVQRVRSTTKPEWDAASWRFVSYTCIGKAGPVSTEEVIHTIESSIRVQVPALQVQTKPPKRTLVNLPTTITQLSPSKIRFRNLHVSGVAVQLWAESALHTKCAACFETPDGLRLKKSGRFPLQVDVTWSAWYTALGIRPIQVPDPQIRQRKTLWINVAQLTSRFWKVG